MTQETPMTVAQMIKAAEKKKGMSTNKKLAIGAGVLGIVAAVAYFKVPAFRQLISGVSENAGEAVGEVVTQTAEAATTV